MKHPKINEALNRLDTVIDSTVLDHKTRTNIKVLARRACTAAASEVLDVIKNRRTKMGVKKKIKGETPSGLKIVSYPADYNPVPNRVLP